MSVTREMRTAGLLVSACLSSPALGAASPQEGMRKWAFGAGGLAALQLQVSRYVHARLHGGYTHYFAKAGGIQPTPDAAPFTVSLDGPFAGALLGVDL